MSDGKNYGAQLTMRDFKTLFKTLDEMADFFHGSLIAAAKHASLVKGKEDGAMQVEYMEAVLETTRECVEMLLKALDEYVKGSGNEKVH